MSVRISEVLVDLLAIALVGLAIKFMDDCLDQELDSAAGARNWACWLGRGLVPYAMLCLGLAAGMRPALSVPLFLAAYALGMVNAPLTLNPSGFLAAWESLTVLLLGLVLFGWRAILWASCLILAIQMGDDFLDSRSSEPAEYKAQRGCSESGPAGASLPSRGTSRWPSLDQVERALIFLILLLVSLRLHFLPSLYALLAAAFIMFLTSRLP